MKVEKPIRNFHSGAVLVREDCIELYRPWPGAVSQNITADLVEVASAVVYLVVSIPLYLLASIALALALYVRCAGVLLFAE